MQLSIKGALFGVALFGFGVTTGLVAQNYSDSPQRVEQKRTDLSGASNMEVIASLSEYKPGEIMQAHTHHGVEVAYVLQGSTVSLPGKDPMNLATGATVMNLRDIKHGGFKITGATTLKLFTVHIVDKGQPLYDYANAQ
jgi:quercetin dioxygenase-like cupin family protein